ncbi:cystathionine gamma-synthase [Gammaproteobacteria bacterium]|nr:cystathionine gamma-synthase [Gammaproteobacteria bacterium]
MNTKTKSAKLKKSFLPDTLVLHGGYKPEQHGRCAAVPIYQTTSFVFDNAQYGADLFDLAIAGNIYSRLSNPTLDVLEQRIAALEGGVGALAVASGMAAIDYAIATISSAGDHIIATSELYGGTHNFFSHILPSRGISSTLVNKNDFTALKAAIKDNTRAIFIESIGNPSGGMVDIKKIAEIAHEAGIVVIVDNTVASPILIRPIEHGADIVVHSATKYIGGHGTVLGGLIIDAGRFDWGLHQARYPQFTLPDPSYHGIIFSDHFGNQAYIARARTVPLRNTGAALSANSAFLLLQGLETLAIRMERISNNTTRIVDYLAVHPLVEKVHHVSIKTHPDHELSKQYISENSTPGIISFELKGGRDTARIFYDALKLFLRLVNIGDSKSLAAIPAETTHHQLDDAALAKVGITPGLVRLSIGIEHVNDLLDDLDQALEEASS